jgi:hypothetical protein
MTGKISALAKPGKNLEALAPGRIRADLRDPAHDRKRSGRRVTVLRNAGPAQNIASASGQK